MTDPIYNNDVSKPQTCQPIKTVEQAMTATEYGSQLATLFMTAKKDGWGSDYLTDQIFQLNQKNPCLAKELGFSEDHPGIKEKFVKPWMEGVDIARSQEGVEKKPEKEGNFLERYFDCHTSNLKKLYRDQFICGISMMGFGLKPNKYSTTSAALSCKDVVTDYVKTLSCLKELKP